MTTEEAFLRRILAEPEDRALRLIYADWLEERGDGRAELIRLEEEMAELPVWSDRYVALKPRRNALRERTDLRWRMKLGYVPVHRPMFGKLPERRVERWRLFEEFFESWFRPRKRADGLSPQVLGNFELRLGIRLPTALCEWYLLAGNLPREANAGGSLTPLEQVALAEPTDLVAFYRDGRSLPAFGFRLADTHCDDPAVYRLSRMQDVVAKTVTQFALRTLVNATIGNRRRHNSVGFFGFSTSRELHDRIASLLTRCELSEPSLSPYEDAVYYESRNLILYVTAEIIFGAARTRDAYENLNRQLHSELILQL